MLKKIYDFLQKKVGAVEKDLYDVSISKEAEGQGKHYLQNSFAYLTIGLRYLFFGVLEFVVKFFVLISKTPHEGYKLLVAPIEKLELEEKELLEHHDYKAFLKMHEKTRVLSFKAVGAAVLAIVIVSLVVTVLVPVGKKILAASYTWTQSSWTGGSSTATASHPDTGTWNKYTSTTTGMLAGSTISLVPATQSFIDSSSPSIPSGATGGDFDLGTNTNTRIANGKIKLASAPPGTIALSLSPNGTFAVALKDDGTIWTWGYNGGTNGNGYGQLGLGHTTDKYLPTQVCTTARTAGTTTTNVGACSTESKTAETGFTAVSAGGNSVIALKSDGTIWTWGTNYTGYSYFYYLGLGHTTDKYLPTQVCTTARTAGTATTYVGACSTESKTAETGFTAVS
ncbi:hypothetical protein HY249_02635, partial [Candidatus Azambacteria bacterium]|nr:hypothetical protein [Candidatus Azambacteria bacterium]